MTIFTLWFLPQMVFYGLTALASAMLNARRRFVAAAYAPVLNNVIVIGVLVAFAHMTAGSRSEWIDVRRISGDAGKLTLLGAGTTAGIAAMGLVLLPAMHHARTRLRAAFDWRHPAVRKMLRLSGWTIGYVVTNQIALLFVLVLAKSGTTGDVSAYLYAYAFYQVPHGLLAVSIMTTMMPELSSSAAQLDFRSSRASSASGCATSCCSCCRPRCSSSRSRNRWSAFSCAAGSMRTTPRSPPTRSRRSRSGSSRSPCTSTRCAASTRWPTRAPRS